MFIKAQETVVFNYPCESKINCYPLSVELSPGNYFIQCYGASGGDSGRGKGGYGAYASGMLQLSNPKTLYIFIGAEGHLELGQRSYNGGGRGTLQISEAGSQGASGGGGTDIRLSNRTDTEGLLSRIIVAGGGGGAESYYGGANGGDAGSFEGGDGEIVIQDDYYSELTVPKGGTQTEGGIGGDCIIKNNNNACLPTYNGENGTFASGGDGPVHPYGGGGGGGYFGGGGGSIADGKVTSGAGGSSYVSGQPGCHTFIKNDDGSLIDKETSIHPSGLYFTSISFVNGTTIKHKGDGKVIISLLMRFNTIVKCNNFFNKIYLYIILFIKWK